MLKNNNIFRRGAHSIRQECAFKALKIEKAPKYPDKAFEALKTRNMRNYD